MGLEHIKFSKSKKIFIFGLLLVLTGCVPVLTKTPPLDTSRETPGISTNSARIQTSTTNLFTVTPTVAQKILITPKATPLTGSPENDGINFEGDKEIGPFAPQNLQVIQQSQSKVLLKWEDPDDLIRKFNIYRKDVDTEQWQKISEITAKPSQVIYTYEDKTVGAGSSYSYVITAVDIYGNESSYSEPAILNSH